MLYDRRSIVCRRGSSCTHRQNLFFMVTAGLVRICVQNTAALLILFTQTTYCEVWYSVIWSFIFEHHKQDVTVVSEGCYSQHTGDVVRQVVRVQLQEQRQQCRMGITADDRKPLSSCIKKACRKMASHQPMDKGAREYSNKQSPRPRTAYAASEYTVLWLLCLVHMTQPLQACYQVFINLPEPMSCRYEQDHHSTPAQC